ncbi:hypothetical protein EVAR_9279_1 [Eumeta japonica]|uniref:Uncharacterized protein n=1 Tax=Eumeta variegata TaxID=151549 RepID=A0A4C1TLN1_EUMVA|nr:hypothetical protein EVAR_9279_1 [Eumeta japonica]
MDFLHIEQVASTLDKLSATNPKKMWNSMHNIKTYYETKIESRTQADKRPGHVLGSLRRAVLGGEPRGNLAYKLKFLAVGAMNDSNKLKSFLTDRVLFDLPRDFDDYCASSASPSQSETSVMKVDQTKEPR